MSQPPVIGTTNTHRLPASGEREIPEFGVAGKFT
jgi:hypothetical protein